MDDGMIESAPHRLERIRESAAGWQRTQLAVFGFVGLCGVLAEMTGSDAPRAVQTAAAVLVLVSLAVALLATFLVGRVAWPHYGTRAAPTDTVADGDLAGATRSLRAGLIATFVAVVILAVATTSGWWPTGGTADHLVQVDTTSGSACGRLVDGAGGIAVEVHGQVVQIPEGTVTGLTPVSSCP